VENLRKIHQMNIAEKSALLKRFFRIIDRPPQPAPVWGGGRIAMPLHYLFWKFLRYYTQVIRLTTGGCLGGGGEPPRAS